MILKQETIYQSILSNLSLVPVAYLPQIDLYLQNFNRIIQKKQRNRQQILQLAGTWNDMTDEDFNDYLFAAKKTSYEILTGLMK